MKNKLKSLYEIRFTPEEQARHDTIWKVLCTDYFNYLIPPHSSVLDIGSGWGGFINHINADKKTAVDLNPSARDRLHTSIHFIQEDVLDLDFKQFADIDCVFISNFLEHLKSKNELESLLEKIHQSLQPGSKVIILGPNIKYLAGDYWDFYDHHIPLTHRSLSEVLVLHGYKINLCLDRFLPYSTKGKLPSHPILVKLFLKLPFFWKILGKQFLVVAERI